MPIRLKTTGRFFQRHYYLTAWLLGCLYFRIVISWMFQIKTGSIVRGTAAEVVALLTALLTVGSLAFGFVIFFWLYRVLRLSLHRTSASFEIAACWVVAEYARSIIFSIVVSGPGGRIGPYWTFGALGYWTVNTPFAFIARWGGLYLLSFFVVALIVAMYTFITEKKVKPILLVLSLICALAWSGNVIWSKPNGQKATVAATQFGTEFDQDEYSQQTAKLLGNLKPKSLDVLVLPEYSHLWEGHTERDTLAVSRVLKDDGLAIDSRREQNPKVGLGHNIVTFRNADGTSQYEQQKWFLIPGGEYVPYSYQAFLAYAGQSDLIKKFNQQKTVEPASKPEGVYAHNNVVFGSHACSAVISPELYRTAVSQGATMLTNSASLDTLGVGTWFERQAKDMARLHAVSNARPFVQASRGSIGYVIDHNGRFLAQTKQRGYSVLVADVAINSKRTFYSIFGDWFIWGSAVVLVSHFTYLHNRLPLELYKRKKKNGRTKNKKDQRIT